MALKLPHSGTCRDASCHFTHHVRGSERLEVSEGYVDAQNDALVIADGTTRVRAHDRVVVVGHGQATIVLFDDAQGYPAGPNVRVERIPRVP